MGKKKWISKKVAARYLRRFQKPRDHLVHISRQHPQYLMMHLKNRKRTVHIFP